MKTMIKTALLKWVALFLLIILCDGTVQAQQMITVSQNAAMTQNVITLNGKAGVVFIANSDDMVITTNINKDPQSPKAVKVGKKYRYDFIIDITSGSNIRIFTVAKYGTTNSQKTDKIMLSANKQLYFDIEQVENGIDLKIDPNAHTGWINGKKGEALIVFNSKIKLSINCPNLKHTIRSGRSVAGTYLDSLIFDANQYKDLSQKESALSDELENANKRIEKEAETLDEATFDALSRKIPQLTEELNNVRGELSKLLHIEISGDKTNKISIDYNHIKDKRPADLLSYNVLILNETKVVVETQYGELLRQADTEFQDRQYARAAEFYKLASYEKNITEAQRNIATDKATAALRYDTVQTNAEKYAKMLNDIISNGSNVKKSLLIKTFDQAILAYKSLLNSTGDTYFKKQMEKLIAEKAKVGIVLEGTTLYSELHQGVLAENAIGNCKFYGVKGAVSEDMRTNIYWKNENELATSDSEGKFKFQVNADQYDFIVVVGAHNGKIKANKVIPMRGRGDSTLKIVFGKKK
ncbi:MAG: hypothetical protein IJG07_06545 [Prevotella sp.]|nr:hypothetical protein [Prevotella sp.]